MPSFPPSSGPLAPPRTTGTAPAIPHRPSFLHRRALLVRRHPRPPSKPHSSPDSGDPYSQWRSHTIAV
jgi:hypothetical protein